jgi:hypothetical protein
VGGIRQGAKAFLKSLCAAQYRRGTPGHQ